MSETPVPRDPGRDGGPPRVPPWPDWMDDPAYLAVRAEDEDPGDLDPDEDPDNDPPPGLDDAELEALIAEAREMTADQARRGHTAVLAAMAAEAGGRRGPGMPGSAESFPGEYASPAAGFASGKPLDTAPGCATLGLFVEDAAGDDDRYTGASDDELLGVICASDRAEAAQAARKHAAIAELIRRRPPAGCSLEGPANMPQEWHEFTARELGAVLGVSAGDAEEMLALAWYLEVNLPGTKAAFRAGILSRDKAAIIAHATMLLEPGEARIAEAMVLGRAGSLTPAQLRAAVRRAVMQVNPGAAKKRREHMAKRTRVERWAEDSGHAGLAGRELPPGRSGRCPLVTVTTGTRLGAMIPACCCVTWPRSGTPHAPGPAADGLPDDAISSTMSRTRRAGGRVCAMGTRSAASTTELSKTRDGRPSNYPTARSGGPRPPGGSTSPNRPGTRSNRLLGTQ